MFFLDDYEIINVIYKAIFYIALPAIITMLLGSFLSSILQSFFSIKEKSFSYCIKIIFLTFLLCFIYPISKDILIEIFLVCLK